MKTDDILIKANAIATNPNSSGDKSRAKKIETTKPLTWVNILPKKSQEKACIVFLLRLNGCSLKFLLNANRSDHQYR